MTDRKPYTGRHRANGESTSEKNGGPKHDTGKPARHSKETQAEKTQRITIAGSDLPPRGKGIK